MISFCDRLPLIYCKFFFWNKIVNLLWEAADTHQFSFVLHFSSAILPTPTLPCLQTAPMGVLLLTLVFAAKLQSVFFCALMLHQQVQEMAQHIRWESMLGRCYPRRLWLLARLGRSKFVVPVQESCRHWENRASWAQVSICVCVWEMNCHFSNNFFMPLFQADFRCRDMLVNSSLCRKSLHAELAVLGYSGRHGKDHKVHGQQL